MRVLPLVMAALLLAAPASAATPLERQVKQLQAQVKVLQRQSEAVRAQVVTLRAENVELRKRVQYVSDYTECALWLGNDFIHLTWTVVDRIAERVMGSVAFGPQQRGDDRGACERVGIPRTLTMSLLIGVRPR